uniref:Uncharacterized protein n=1 Tax=Salix viminalis TaxID=40686 RepID=A0A6N2MK16_SALVM
MSHQQNCWLKRLQVGIHGHRTTLPLDPFQGLLLKSMIIGELWRFYTRDSRHLRKITGGPLTIPLLFLNTC